jgi:cytochrome c biogenesis protein CcmG, thiol:disulfide interchange protein DsbE
MIKYTLTLFAVIFTTLVFSQTTDSTTSELPDISLKNIDGEDINFSDYGKNGKITIISFWATWCKPCIRELKNVSDLLDEWIEEYDLEMVAVSVDDTRNIAKVKPFVAGRGWDFQVLLDPNGDLQRAMNVVNPPVTFLVDQNGKIIYTHVGYVDGDEYELEEKIKIAAGK